MSNCDQKYLVVDYFFNELNREEKQQFEKHLSYCGICQENLTALVTTSRIMKHQKREQPERELLQKYHIQLANEFSENRQVTSAIEKILEKFIRRPSIAIRLAEAMVLILIGIFIGKTTIWKSTSAPESIALNDVPLQSQVEELLLKHYLQQTEMILLDVANLDPVEDEKLIFNLIQSTKYRYLLQKTLFLREQAKELENHQLSELLNQIELILLELYNMEKNAFVETLSVVKQQLKDSHLLIEIKSMNQIEI
ncbi:MAG: hypothetical protein JSW07_19350 [bacterium]|nr:MAG: hypothetical protein JSW07_19350 [bacterium]